MSKPIKNKSHRILVVDDHIGEAEILIKALNEAFDYRISQEHTKPNQRPFLLTLETDSTAVIELISKRAVPFDIIIADVFMPESANTSPSVTGGALKIFGALEKSQHVGNILLLATSNKEERLRVEVKAIEVQSSAQRPKWFFFVEKPVSANGELDTHLWIKLVTDAIFKWETGQWNNSLLAVATVPWDATSDAWKQAVAQVQTASEWILILYADGGSGVEKLGRLFHQRSGKEGEFEQMSLDLSDSGGVEMLLVGSVNNKTEGTTTQEGMIDEANDGTLLLDFRGIEEALSTPLQQRLDDLFKRKKYKPSGSADYKNFTGHLVLVAENKDQLQIALGSASRALVATKSICMPSLSERPEDIAPWAEKFLQAHQHVLDTSSKKFLESLDTQLNEKLLELLCDRLKDTPKRELTKVDIEPCGINSEMTCFSQ